MVDRYISDEIPNSLIFYLSKALPLFTSWPISVYKPKAIRFINEKGDELVPDITFFVFYILNIYYRDYIVLDVEKLLEYLKKFISLFRCFRCRTTYSNCATRLFLENKIFSDKIFDIFDLIRVTPKTKIYQKIEH